MCCCFWLPWKWCLALVYALFLLVLGSVSGWGFWAVLLWTFPNIVLLYALLRLVWWSAKRTGRAALKRAADIRNELRRNRELDDDGGIYAIGD